MGDICMIAESHHKVGISGCLDSDPCQSQLVVLTSAGITQNSLEFMIVLPGISQHLYCSCVPLLSRVVIHQQKVYWSRGASRSGSEKVECKLQWVNFRKVSDPRWVF